MEQDGAGSAVRFQCLIYGGKSPSARNIVMEVSALSLRPQWSLGHLSNTWQLFTITERMDLELKKDCLGVDWTAVAGILERVGMAHHAPEAHRDAFTASYCTVFAYSADQLIGFGRAICGGAYQGAVYDCAVIPEFQG